MKAAQISAYGGPEVIKITEATKPNPAEGQVLVEVHATGVNPFDDKVKAGMMKEMRPLEFPSTVGGDIAGIVVRGSGAFKPGDKIWGSAGVFGGGSGAIAEFAVTQAAQLGKMPNNLTFEQAGVMPLVGLSATQALIDMVKLDKGQTILIQGAAGGIGSIAVQLAKYLGAHVFVTASGEAADFVRSLGADEVIDYKKEDFRTKVSNVDAVFDTVGGKTFEESYTVLKPGGILVTMAARPTDEQKQKYNVRAEGMGTKTTTELLDRLSDLVQRGAIHPIIDKIYPLDEAEDAFRDFEAGNIRGKIGIKVR